MKPSETDETRARKPPRASPEPRSFRLDGKRVLVAEASSGIGLATAVALAEAGVHAALAARNGSKLRDLAQGMGVRGLSAEPLVLDVADVARAEATVARAGPFDILVNSAGHARHGSALKTDAGDFDIVTGINFRGAYFPTRAVAEGFASAGRPGSLMNIFPQMGHVGGIDRTVYCTTKHAVEGTGSMPSARPSSARP